MWTVNDIPDQNERVIVITGANSGVGYESALTLVRKRARVVMACRSLDKAERARQDILRLVPDAKLDILQLNLSSLKSIHSFADAFNASYDRLDVLMNNAGIMIPPYGKTADGFETQFGSNHLGHFALTGLLLPKLLQTPKSRVVTVSSSAYLNGRINFDDLQSEKHYAAWAAYGQSKLANILFMLELQRKLEAMHADVISVASQPGFARTNLQKHDGPFIQEVGMQTISLLASQSAALGARYELYAATAPDVRGGEYYEPRWVLKGTVVRHSINARGHNAADAARLWQISEQLTGVQYPTSQPEQVLAGASVLHA